MAKPQYKYHLNEFINMLPSVWTIDRIAKEVEKYGIARRTFDRDKSLKLKDQGDIPGERLFVYARLFNCSIMQLFNFDKKVRPFIKLKLSRDMRDMMKKHNLKLPNYTI